MNTSKKSSLSRIKNMSSYDDLVAVASNDENGSKFAPLSYDDLLAEQGNYEKTIEVAIDDLHEFKNHPFKVIHDEKMEELIESIKLQGVLNPAIVRNRPEGGYELISGHRRRYACICAGYVQMPVYVKNMSDEEAIIAMVNANIQRETLLPSEKAKSYRMKYDALSYIGKNKGGNSLEQLSKESGEHEKKIQRYLSISRLNDELLNMLDNKQLGFGQGIDISFLAPEQQSLVYQYLMDTGIKLNAKQSKKIKILSQNHEFDEESLLETLLEEQPTTVKVSAKNYKEYFPENYSTEQIDEIIRSLLDRWKLENDGGK